MFYPLISQAGMIAPMRNAALRYNVVWRIGIGSGRFSIGATPRGAEPGFYLSGRGVARVTCDPDRRLHPIWAKGSDAATNRKVERNERNAHDISIVSTLRFTVARI